MNNLAPNGPVPANDRVASGVDRAFGSKLLGIILAQDGWTIQPLSQRAMPGEHDGGRAGARPANGATARLGLDAAVFIARKDRRRIAFFFSDQEPRLLTRAFAQIKRADRGRFNLLGVLVAPTTVALHHLRSPEQARRFPRAFFTSLAELQEVVALVAPAEYAAVGTPVPRRSFTAAAPEPAGGIASFPAEVLTNTAVGGPQSGHYRLAFRAPLLQEVRPPQFVMMDTTPARVPLGARAVRRGRPAGAMDLAPRPLLKRPFGICRDFHPDFATDYLRRLRLPPALGLALQIAAPDHFDMLYKVLPNGLGTALMTKLKRGQKVHMLGPLGRPFDVRRLRAAGIQEVHVIGGGVGMAPLILLVEALRYYAFPVKVFLGIAALESLRYRDELAATFGEKPRDAYIYIDDLLAAGVPPADIYVSCDSASPARVRGLPKENLFHGLVPEQYRRFLAARLALPGCHPGLVEGSPSLRRNGEIPRQARNDKEEAPGRLVAFTCGPNRMMEVMADITRAAGVPLKVLLEKRMGCGLGVCFSCVQKVRRADGTADYARVCTEGPLFDAKDILWKNDDSKSPSVNCGCAARC